MADFAILRERLRKFVTHQFGRGASPAEIAAGEQALGLTFPESYRAFLSEFGWGGVEDIEVFGLGLDVPTFLDLVRVTHVERLEAEPQLPQHLLPILNDGYGNHYCLDTSIRNDNESPVVFWDHEAGPDQEPEVVASTFVDWLMQEVEEREER